LQFSFSYPRILNDAKHPNTPLVFEIVATGKIPRSAEKTKFFLGDFLRIGIFYLYAHPEHDLFHKPVKSDKRRGRLSGRVAILSQRRHNQVQRWIRS